jgi:dTDP-4-amino-4,6-dideoxygalactose transaminase
MRCLITGGAGFIGSNLVRYLLGHGHADFHHIPLHNSLFAATLGSNHYHLPYTDDLSGRLLRLPLYASLTDEQCRSIAQAIGAFTQYHHA